MNIDARWVALPLQTRFESRMRLRCGVLSGSSGNGSGSGERHSSRRRNRGLLVAMASFFCVLLCFFGIFAFSQSKDARGEATPQGLGLRPWLRSLGLEFGSFAGREAASRLRKVHGWKAYDTREHSALGSHDSHDSHAQASRGFVLVGVGAPWCDEGAAVLQALQGVDRLAIERGQDFSASPEVRVATPSGEEEQEGEPLAQVPAATLQLVFVELAGTGPAASSAAAVETAAAFRRDGGFSTAGTIMLLRNEFYLFDYHGRRAAKCASTAVSRALAERLTNEHRAPLNSYLQ